MDIAGYLGSMITSFVSVVIGWIAWLVVLGVGVYTLITLIIGKFQFYVGFLFGPLGLLLAPLDKGRVFSATVSMMLSGLVIFVVAFSLISVSIGVFAGTAEKFSAWAQTHGEGGMYKMMFSLASILYAYIIWMVVQNATSWGSSLFGNIGFNMRQIARSIAAAPGAGAEASSTVVKHAGRGTSGVLGGMRGGIKEGFNKDWHTNWYQTGFSKVLGAIEGSGKGLFSALRGRGPNLSKEAPQLGSGMRLVDSFRDGKASMTSKISSSSKELLSKSVSAPPSATSSSPKSSGSVFSQRKSGR